MQLGCFSHFGLMMQKILHVQSNRAEYITETYVQVFMGELWRHQVRSKCGNKIEKVGD